MAKITIIQDQRNPDKSGLCPLYVRVSNKKQVSNIPIGLKLPPSNYIDGACTGRWKSYNGELLRIQSIIDSEEIKLGRRLSLLSAADIVNHLRPILFEEEKKLLSIREAFELQITRAKSSGTKVGYEATLRKLSTMIDVDSPLADISISKLRELDSIMLQSIKINSVSIHFRNIRAVFNTCIDEELIDISCYPFRKFKIKKEATRKRSLTIEQIKLLRDYPCEAHQRKYIDLFMLILYLQGINIIDLCLLTPSSICNGRIEYKRAKTGRLYSIAITDQAMEIINKYKGINYLLDVMDVYGYHKNFMHRFNKNLKEIGPVSRSGLGGKKHREPLFPDISTYWARHTWATIASRLDIPKETIAAGLGHSTNSVTDIYIDFDMKKVDVANRMIIDAIR